MPPSKICPKPPTQQAAGDYPTLLVEGNRTQDKEQGRNPTSTPFTRKTEPCKGCNPQRLSRRSDSAHTQLKHICSAPRQRRPARITEAAATALTRQKLMHTHALHNHSNNNNLPTYTSCSAHSTQKHGAPTVHQHTLASPACMQAKCPRPVVNHGRCTAQHTVHNLR